MATLQDVMKSLTSVIGNIPQYTGQESPDNYYSKIVQTFSYGEILGVGGFDDVVKTKILISKMAGKYAPVPDQHNGNNINTPERFKAWIKHKYDELTYGLRQTSLTKLMQEKFLPSDTPETYEERIRLLLLQTPNDNPEALEILWKQLPFELYSTVKIAQPNNIDDFFIAVRNLG